MVRLPLLPSTGSYRLSRSAALGHHDDAERDAAWETEQVIPRDVVTGVK